MEPSPFIRRPIFFAWVAVSLLTAMVFIELACSRKSTGWKGRIETEGDVVVVKNPKEPLFGPEVLSLEEDLAVGGEEGADYVFGAISSIAVRDDGTIFVLDSEDKNIKVYDRDGELIRTFGRAGQGPGEFTLPRNICTLAGGEVVVFDVTRRLEFFKANGEHIRTLSMTSHQLAEVRPDSSGNFYAYQFIYGEANPRYELTKVDGEFKDLFAIESSPLPNTERDGFNPFFPVLRWAPLSRDRVVCGHAVEYELRIHDASGRVERKIRLDTDPVPIDQDDVEERTKGTPPDLLKTMKIPGNYPEFRYIMTDDEDRIWVLSWERPPGRVGFYADVFDPEGRYLVRAVIPVIQPLIQDGRLYAAEETEEGYPVLKRYKIGWNF